jgi:hypothetical protein
LKVKELLSRPENWIKHQFAVNKEGNCTDPENDNACAWCLLGAIDKCYEKHESPRIRDRVRFRINGGAISSWNDSPLTRYENVIKLVEELDI